MAKFETRVQFIYNGTWIHKKTDEQLRAVLGGGIWMSEVNRFSINDLLDRALHVVKVKGSTKISNVNNLLEVLESERDEIGSIYLTAAFALRQASRNVLDRRMATEVARNLIEIASSDVPNKKQVARKFLGLVRWLFEVADRMGLDLGRVQRFEDLVKLLGGAS